MQKAKKTVQQAVVALVVGVSVLTGVAFTTTQPAGALSCSVLPSDICDKAEAGGTSGGTFQLLKWVLTVMNALVGIAAVGGVIWAGILYTSAGDKMDQVKKSKTIIIDVVIGLMAYGLMYLALNWIVPGGVFK